MKPSRASETERRDDLMAVRALLDDALVGLRAIADPAVPLRESRDAVAAALEHVYRALASWANYKKVQEEANQALERCREALGALQHRETEDQGALADIALVAQAIGALRSNARVPAEVVLDLPTRRPSGAVPASRDEPRELDVARDVLPPGVPVPLLVDTRTPELDLDAAPTVTIESPADLERYAAQMQADHGPASDRPPASEPEATPDAAGPVDVDGLYGHAVPERVLIRRRAEGFLEELAAMSLMRQADASDVWFELAPVEQRLLARIDALVACGDEAYAATLDSLEDRPLPDPELLWAALFFFGSLRGSDAVHQVARLVRSSNLENAALFEAVTDALTFAPNRGIEEYARGLTASDDLRTRCVGIRVLGRRAACTTSELSPRIAAASDPGELRELAMALETAHGPVATEDSRRLLGSRDSAVFAAAAQMAALRGQHAALSQARIHVDQGRGDFGEAALICALVGDESDVQRVLEAAARDTTESLVEAVGWTGYVPAVPFLLGRQEAGSSAATLALQRITGATLLPDAPLPTYDDEDEARPFGAAHVPWDHEAILSEDPDLWRAWWEAHGRRADPARRYRFGHQWTTLDNLFEMERAAGTARARRLAYIELAARTGVELPFDPRSFVVRQHRQLAEWREAIAVRRDRAPAGTWRHRLS